MWRNLLFLLFKEKKVPVSSGFWLSDPLFKVLQPVLSLALRSLWAGTKQYMHERRIYERRKRGREGNVDQMSPPESKKCSGCNRTSKISGKRTGNSWQEGDISSLV